MGVCIHEHGSKARFSCYTPEIFKLVRFVFRTVYDINPEPHDSVCFEVLVGQYLGVFAYRALTDMGLKQEQAINVLRFFRDEFSLYTAEHNTPFILSLNDGRYAVLITEPENRRIYDYADDVDRTHPSQAIPLPAPIIQASVNLSRVAELGLDIR